MLALLSIIIVLCICFAITGYFSEKKAYNKGNCPNCKTELENFDMASDSSRGYVCRKCSYTTWVSYNKIDKNI